MFTEAKKFSNTLQIRIFIHGGINRSAEQTNRFAVHAICLSRAPIHSPWTQNKDTHSLNVYIDCYRVQRLISSEGAKRRILDDIAYCKLWESHWLFRRICGFIFTAAAVYMYMARVTSRKLHCDVMKTHYSWCHSKFFPYNFQTSGMFLSPQRLQLSICWNWSVFF